MMSQQAGEIFGYAKLYGEQQVKLVKLDLAERFSKVTSGLALLMVLFVSYNYFFISGGMQGTDIEPDLLKRERFYFCYFWAAGLYSNG